MKMQCVCRPASIAARWGWGLMFCAVSLTLAQAQQPSPQLTPPDQTLTPDQLDDLVAPIALYPDPLLSQILVAATYPLEVVEANQWVRKNVALASAARMQAAQHQEWDPSVQALVVFPDALERLNEDIRWTTNLGNAFLAQPQAVMDAVQRMRQRARDAGKLPPSVQQDIIADGEYIQIVPAYPDVIYVPVYDPIWIWGPPLWYPYPIWRWPPRSVIITGLWWGWGPVVDVSICFGVGWHGWAGWGWFPGWHDRRILVNNVFIHRYGFKDAHPEPAHGTSPWQHDPEHRAGIPYPNAQLREQFRGNVRQSISPRAPPQAGRGNAPGGERMGDRNVTPNVRDNRSAFGGQENGASATQHEEHGLSSMGPQRSAPAPAAPRTSTPAPSPRAVPPARGTPIPRTPPRAVTPPRGPSTPAPGAGRGGR